MGLRGASVSMAMVAMMAMVSSDYIPLPEEFVRWAERVGLGELLAALDDVEHAPVSVRLNREKKSALRLAIEEAVPWTQHGEGIYLKERPAFTADPVFHGGAYYVQESGSMSVGNLFRELDPGGGVRVLDLCAAPGGKTTHLASMVGGEMHEREGFVVANEVIRSRAKTLAENVQKWGTGNVSVTSNDPAEFGERLAGYFDVVVVDAPCSGEGMFRKDTVARAEWSPDHVRLCAARQRRIVRDVWNALRSEGAMIYSTCTFNERENEQNVRWIAETLGGEITRELHFYPHRVRSEGFYAAVIRKTGRGERTPLKRLKNGVLREVAKADVEGLRRWVADEMIFGTAKDGRLYGYRTEGLRTMTDLLLKERFNLLYSGVQMGELIRGGLKPDHALALYSGLNVDGLRVTELEDAAAMEYLRKGNAMDLLPATTFREGLNLVTCRGIGLGWAKRIGNRYNNLYPQNWRVLHY